MKRQMLMSTAAAAAALLIVTCGPAGIDALRDGGGPESGALLDVLEGPDAAADVYVGACDTEVRNWVDYGDGRYNRQTTWYAEVDAPGFDAARVESAFVVLCDFERFGPIPRAACPAGATCTIDPAPAEAGCLVNGGVEVVGGRLRAYCGQRTDYSLTVPPAAPVVLDYGARPRSVRFVVR